MTNYLYISLYLFSFLSLLIFLIILIYHKMQNRKKKKITEYQEKYYPIIDDYINKQVSLKKAKNMIKDDIDYELMVEFLNPLLKRYSGEKYEKLIILFQQAGINDYYLKKLKSNKQKEKLKAASIIGKLEDERALNKLNQMLESQENLVIITASWALSDIGNKESLDKIINALFNKTNMTYEAITELLVNFDEEICDNLLNFINNYLEDKTYFTTNFEVAEFKLLSLFIDIFGYFRYEQSLPVMKKLLKINLHEEVIIHIFKSLVKIGKPIEIEFSNYLSHKNWVIRSQTAKYLSIIKISSHIDKLKELLSDDNWWVRYYAAKAIWELGHIDLLVDIIIKNKPGANICDYILAQNNYNYVLGDKNDI